MKLKKLISAVILSAISIMAVSGCSANQNEQSGGSVESAHEQSSAADEQNENNEEIASDNEKMNIVMLKGPTAIGAASLMEKSDNENAVGNYNFTIETSPDTVVGRIVSGEADAAAVPSNVAAALYNKTEGGVQVVAINTLGTLYLIENGNSINSADDLSNKTIYSSGQGAVPEYVLNYIISSSGAENVDVKFMSSHDELAAAVASGQVDNALLPEPYVDVALSKNNDLRIALDIAQCWDQYTGLSFNGVPNSLPMGCLVVRREYAQNNSEAIKTLAEEYSQSIDYVNTNTSKAAEYVVSYGIIEDREIAESAIPKCNISYVDGDNMKDIMDKFIDVMFSSNPKSIGGKLPEEDFYYSIQ